MAYRDEDFLIVPYEKVEEAFHKVGIKSVSRERRAFDSNYGTSPLLKNGKIGRTRGVNDFYQDIVQKYPSNTIWIYKFSDTFWLVHIGRNGFRLLADNEKSIPIKYLQPIIKALCPPIPIAIDSDGNEYDRAFYYGAVIDSYGMPTFDLIELDGFTMHIPDNPYLPDPIDPIDPIDPNTPDDPDDEPGGHDNPRIEPHPIDNP